MSPSSRLKSQVPPGSGASRAHMRAIRAPGASSVAGIPEYRWSETPRPRPPVRQTLSEETLMSLPILSLLGALSLAPEPLLLVLSKAEHTMVLVDPVTLAIVGRVATGHGPHEVAVSSDGRTAYVTNYGAQVPGASISVVDLGSLAARELPLDSLRRPHGIVVSGGRVYFTAEVNQFVGRLDPAATGVDWGARTAQLATHMVVATPDGRSLYTANIGSHTISRID